MNTRGNLFNIVKGILTGYTELLKKFLMFFAVLGGIFLASGLIVLPLWYFATQAKQLFTIVVLSLAGIGFFVLIGVRIKRAIEYHRYYFNSSPLKQFFYRAAQILVKAMFFLVCTYILLLLYSRSLLWLAIPLTIIFVLTAGYFLYGRKNREPQTSS